MTDPIDWNETLDMLIEKRGTGAEFDLLHASAIRISEDRPELQQLIMDGDFELAKKEVEM